MFVICLPLGGGDPRLKATDLNTPSDITSDQTILDIFNNWDVAQTDLILKEREAQVQARNDKSKKRKETEKNEKENNLREIEKHFETAKLTVNKAYCELEKRIGTDSLIFNLPRDRALNVTCQAQQNGLALPIRECFKCVLGSD